MAIISSVSSACWPLLRRGRNTSRRGVAALEFAISAPLLIVLMMSMYDAANGWLAWQRMAVAAQSVGQIATLVAVNADGTNSLSHDQAWRASTAVYAAMPELLAAGAKYGVTMTEVEFFTYDSCNTTSCTADVSWSTVLLGAVPPRLCGTLAVVANQAPTGSSVLPENVFQAAPVLVVDVAYQFTPMFLGTLTGPIAMARSAYLPVRSGVQDQSISYDDVTAACPPPPTPCPPRQLKASKRVAGAQKGRKQDDAKCANVPDRT